MPVTVISTTAGTHAGGLALGGRRLQHRTHVESASAIPTDIALIAVMYACCEAVVVQHKITCWCLWATRSKISALQLEENLEYTTAVELSSECAGHH